MDKSGYWRIPLVRAEIAGDDSEERGLAVRVLTDDGRHLAGTKLEIDAVQAEVGIVLAERPALERRIRNGRLIQITCSNLAESLLSILFRFCAEAFGVIGFDAPDEIEHPLFEDFQFLGRGGVLLVELQKQRFVLQSRRHGVARREVNERHEAGAHVAVDHVSNTPGRGGEGRHDATFRVSVSVVCSRSSSAPSRISVRSCRTSCRLRPCSASSFR